jgi:hypothetical protein
MPRAAGVWGLPAGASSDERLRGGSGGLLDARARAWRSRAGVAGSSELHSGCRGHHWCSPCVHRGDDLLDVDALQVDAGGPEVDMAELALDDVERNSLACELDGVCVAKLVRREASSDACLGACRRSSLRTAAADHGRPRVGPSITQNSAPTGSSMRSVSQGLRFSQPHVSMPTSRRRPPCRSARAPSRAARQGRAR